MEQGTGASRDDPASSEFCRGGRGQPKELVETCCGDTYAQDPCIFAQHAVPFHAIEVLVVLTLPVEHVIRGRHPPIVALSEVKIVNR
jgi:hypothetical protein